jgi:Fe-S cluster assembly scaffold protein SufB
MTEVLVGRGAHLRVVNLQNWGQRVWHFAHQKALVERDATLQWTVAALGSRLAKVNQEVGLVGQGASCQVNGVLFTEGTQHQPIIRSSTMRPRIAVVTSSTRPLCKTTLGPCGAA